MRVLTLQCKIMREYFLLNIYAKFLNNILKITNKKWIKNRNLISPTNAQICYSTFSRISMEKLEVRSLDDQIHKTLISYHLVDYEVKAGLNN